jgi:hypothetical protein
LFDIAPLTEETARSYGMVRADLASRGEIIGSNDLWIAAQAKANGLTLVTGNEREFSRVAGLKIENWTVLTQMSASKLRLGVNIDHVATIRNARGGRHPDPVKAALGRGRGGR